MVIPLDLLARLRAERVVAIVRGRDADASVATVEALVDNGFGLVEVSLSGAEALRVLRRVRASLGSRVCLGAGTVLTVADLDAALAEGVEYVVTPGITDGAREAARRGIPLLCGALTPTEVWQAHALGATAVKVFPASLHGPGYLKALREPYPQVPLVAVGGVVPDLVRPFLDAGAVGVGVGSPLVGDAPHGGSLEALRDNAMRFRAVL